MSSRLPGRFCCLIVTLTFVAGTVAGQIVPGEGMDSGLGGNNTITGTVYGPSGSRLTRRIQVRLSTATRGDRTSMTDDYGNFIFQGVPGGNYTIVIDKEKEFEPFRQPVDIVQLRGSPPQTYSLSVRLTSKSSSESKPGVLHSALASVPKQALDHFQNAQKLAKDGDRRGAVEELKLAIAAHPTFMLAYSELGVLYLGLNELDKADEALSAALKITPDAFAALLNRGIVLFTAKRYSDAATVLRTAVQKEPENPVAHYFLGQALANLGQFDEAEKELVFALTKGGEELKEAHRILAIIYASRGDKKRAISSIEAYLKLTPNAPDADKLRAAVQQWRTDLGESSKSTLKPN
ncbi:MAG TPA: tetratricopeptide repeat protein [Pyrinomonadaceae bacterium]|nr:tetratricopeptide repeat protein [Pyrinomonadaceae bacterium]